MDSRWRAGGAPRVAGALSFNRSGNSGPRTHGVGLARSDTSLVGKISSADAPLPHRAGLRGGRRRALVDLETKSESFGNSPILLMVGSSCRDSYGGLRLATRSSRERCGFTSTADGPPLARNERGRVAGLHGLGRRTRYPPRCTKSTCEGVAGGWDPHHSTHGPPRRSARPWRRLFHLLNQPSGPSIFDGRTTRPRTTPEGVRRTGVGRCPCGERPNRNASQQC